MPSKEEEAREVAAAATKVAVEVAGPPNRVVLRIIVIILAAIFIAIYVVLPSLGSQFPVFAEQAKGYWKSLGDKTRQFNEYFRGHRIPDPIVNALDNAVPRLVENVSATVSGFVSAALAYVIYIPWLILIPILAFF